MSLLFIEEVGMKFPTSKSKHERKMGLYECSGCGKRDERPIATVNAGYTNWCVECGKKARKKQHKG